MTTINYSARHGFKLAGGETGAWMDTTNSTTDLSGNSKTLTEVGSISKTAANEGDLSLTYSGFSAANYLERAYDVDFDLLGSPATDGHTLMGWVYVSGVSDIDTIIDRMDTGGTGARYNLRISADGTTRATVSDGTNTHICDSLTDLTNTGWNHIVAVWDGVDTQAIYINGKLNVFDNGGSAVTSLVNGSAIFRIGLSATGTDACNQGLSLCKVLPYFVSASTAKEIYNSEKELFVSDAVWTEYGELVTVTFPVVLLNRSGKAIRKATDSIGGNRQVMFDREDIAWSITTSEIQNALVLQIQLMISALYRGNTMQFDAYDTSSFTTCILDSDSYIVERIETSDYFMISFNIKELQ